jgi:hypothetical protein
LKISTEETHSTKVSPSLSTTVKASGKLLKLEQDGRDGWCWGASFKIFIFKSVYAFLKTMTSQKAARFPIIEAQVMRHKPASATYACQAHVFTTLIHNKSEVGRDEEAAKIII